MPDMKVLILISVLCCHGYSQEVDPFSKPVAEPAKRPQRIAPSAEELKKLKEPSLKDEKREQGTDVRFIWVPTFHRPISIRASGNGGKIALRVVRMKGKGGYDWGEIETDRMIEISQKQWSQLVSLIAVDGAREPSQKAEKELRENFLDAMSGFDGSTWFLEVRDKKGYTVEGVPNPMIEDAALRKKLKQESKLDLDPFLAVCLKLFELSGLDEKPSY